MADVKISALTSAGTLDGTELIPVVQGGVTKQTAASNLTHNPVIAYGEFNLNDVASNVLTWTTGCTAENTAPEAVVVYLTENDTYVNPGQAEVLATLIALFSGAYPSDDNGLSIKLNGDIIIGFDTGTPYANYSAFYSDIKSKLISNGYGADDGSGQLVITNKVGTGSSDNGKIISIVVGVTNYLSSSNAFAGGQAAVSSTAFELKHDGNTIKLGIELDGIIVFLSQLIVGKKISTTILNDSVSSIPIFSNSGNWALPVTVGTDDDFRIAVKILGIRI